MIPASILTSEDRRSTRDRGTVLSVASGGKGQSTFDYRRDEA
jgi:hypothetical protein